MSNKPYREFNCLLLKEGKGDAYNTYSLAQKRYETKVRSYISSVRPVDERDVLFLLEQAETCYYILVGICKERGMFCDGKATSSIQQLRKETREFLNIRTDEERVHQGEPSFPSFRGATRSREE